MLLGVVVVRFPLLDMYNNRVVEYYGKELLEPLEPDSILIMTSDYKYDSVVYTQLVLGYSTRCVALHVRASKATLICYPTETLPSRDYNPLRSI